MTTLTQAAGRTVASTGSRTGFGLAVTSSVLMMAGASAPSPFYPVLQQRFAYSADMTTVVFASYALVLLVTLLVAGSASDHLGRRGVISTGFVLLAASVLVFWHADSLAMLVGARVLQGVASGLLLSALSAATVDNEPAGRPGLAATWNSVAPMLGLAVGAIGAGVVLEVTDLALRDVFGALTLAYVLLAVAAWLPAETSPRREGLLASLRPRVALPRAVRPRFVQSVPAIVAGWATGGLYLSLGASIVASELGQASHVTQGLVLGVLAGAGAVAGFLVRRRPARFVTIFGSTALAVGTALTLVALVVGSVPGYFVAVAVAGSGFGTAFLGVQRSIMPQVPARDRAEVFAALFAVSYLAFSVPAVAAGVVVSHLGLRTTTLAYGAAVTVLATVAALLRRFGARD